MENEILKTVILAGIKEQRANRRWKIFFRIVWLLIIAGIIWVIASGGHDTLPKPGKQIAVVDLYGLIDGDNKTYKNLSNGLQTAFKDKKTAAVVISANSPGGSPVYSDMAYNEILRLRKLYPKIPVYVVIEEVCASGCYYIASAANKIYASPASIVGSIGVIYTGFGVNGLMDKLGVDNRLLIAGKNKAMGYPFNPPNKEQESMQQGMLDKIHRQFITAVKNGRGGVLHNDPDLFSGRYWIGEDSLNLGLIDGFATVDSLARDQFNSENIVDFTEDNDPVDKIIKKFTTSLTDNAKQSLIMAYLGTFN
ncbi:MAG: S49 family peptidase [Burkholderiales bacterium]|nr:S49 family peptidase [Burkholderiales bacterium]